MEYSIKKENCPVSETVLETISEQPVDLDLSLPDYCPDIERILKCRMCPCITSKSITGDRLDIDGITQISLFYLDSKKQTIRLCEHSSPFSCSVNIKNSRPDMISCIRLRTDYLNCRAVSPRRLDIHGAFSVISGIYAKGERSYCSSVEGDDIQQRLRTEPLSILSGTGQQQFSISEVLDIGQGKGSPESILRSELSFRLDDSRVIDDKMMLKGDAVLRILYITDIETGAQDHMSFTIPVSQIIDVTGISDTTENDISVDILNYNVTLKSEFDESSTLITLDAHLIATVFAYSQQDVTVIEDVYSTDYELDCERTSVPVTRLLNICDLTTVLKDEIRTGDSGLTKVIDLWCEGISSIVSVDSSRPVIKGKINCCLLAMDSNNIPFCCEKAIDFNIQPDCGDIRGTLSSRTEPAVTSMSYRITGDNSIEIKADLRLRAALYETCICTAVTSVQAQDDKKRQKDDTAAMTIYYADEGESLWDIARSYCTSVDALKQENDLSEDIVQSRGMILIPM